MALGLDLSLMPLEFHYDFINNRDLALSKAYRERSYPLLGGYSIESDVSSAAVLFLLSQLIHNSITESGLKGSRHHS